MSRQLFKGVYLSSSLLLSWASEVPCALVHTLVLLCALCAHQPAQRLPAHSWWDNTVTRHLKSTQRAPPADNISSKPAKII